MSNHLAALQSLMDRKSDCYDLTLDEHNALLAAIALMRGQSDKPVAWLLRDRKTKVVWLDENSHFDNEAEAVICAMDMNDEIDDADFEAFAVYSKQEPAE